MSDRDIRGRIIDYLYKFQTEERAHVLFAIESGSRAWGFESKDSDYDVRFVYVRDISEYLSVVHEPARKLVRNIEHENGLIDLVGWDIRKYLNLMLTSNMQCYEWPQSPIRYLWNQRWLGEIDEALKNYFVPTNQYKHHINLAGGHFKRYIHGREMVRLKKYFYVLRSCLASMYLDNLAVLPPLNFEELLDESEEVPANVREEIRHMLSLKRSGFESTEVPAIECVNNFLWERCVENYAPLTSEDVFHDPGKANKLFKRIVEDYSK